MRGAPQVGLSATIRKIRSRTSWEAGLLPIGPLALETNFQYRRNPGLCQRTTVSGLTKMRLPPTGPETQCQILKEETLSGAKKANQRCDTEFDMSKHGGQL